jgi:hypothetical protein
MSTQFFTAPDMLNFAAKARDGSKPPEMLV